MRSARFFGSQALKVAAKPQSRNFSTQAVSGTTLRPRTKIQEEFEVVKQLRFNGKLTEAWHKIKEIERNYPIHPKGPIIKYKGEIGAELAEQLREQVRSTRNASSKNKLL